MPQHHGFSVLTINPRDQRKEELSNLIRTYDAPIYISEVSGFGQPELRIGTSEYIRGLAAITTAIQQTWSPK